MRRAEVLVVVMLVVVVLVVDAPKFTEGKRWEKS
jgi:hypothetical protein